MLTFGLLSIVMVVGAVGVITLKQPVHAALSLVGTLLTLAVTYVTLQAHFLAAIQVIVYAGAIMVLFLFVIMLLNVQGEERETTFTWMRPAAYATGVIAAAGIIVSAFRTPGQLPDAAVIAAALGGGSAAAVGEALFTDFLLAFQLVGVLLLTGIVGAVSLVQRKAESAAQAQGQAAATPAKRGGVAVLERGDSSSPSPPSRSPTARKEASAAAPVAQTPRTSGAETPLKSTLKPAPKNRAETNKTDAKVTPPELKSPTSDAAQPDDKKSTDTAKAKGDTDASSREKPSKAKAENDDLKRISGVGPKLEGLLHRNGITTFEQIANLSPSEVAELDEKLESFKGRIERDEWLKQARELVEEKNETG